MAAEAIKIPCKIWPHRTKNANASYDHLALTTNDYMSEGLKAPDNVISDICFKMVQPINQTPNATPASKIRVTLLTGIAGTSNFRLLLALQKVIRGTTSIDFTGTFAATVLASAGAGIEKNIDLPISGACAVGDIYEGVIRREGADAADGIAGDVFISEVNFVCDT